MKVVLCGISEIFLPMFSSRTFMVAQLIFKFVIHLDFSFVYGVSWWSSFIFLHVAVQFSQHDLLKRLFYSTVYSLPICQILIDHGDMGLFLGSLFCSLISTSVLMPVPECFDYSGPVIQFDVRYGCPSYFVLFKIAAAIQGHLWFHINF